MYSISGIIIHGSQQAKKLGFPTANIIYQGNGLKDGVYKCQVRLPYFHIITYDAIGTYMKKKERFEVYIFDFDHDIYDQMIEIDCIQYIRKNHHFETKELLIDQIKKDIVQVRKLIAT